jgi:hypothetical protein
MYCIDRDGNGVVVEFKRGRAELAGVSQLKRYVDEIKEKHEKKVRGILVAPNIASSALKLLKEYGLEYVKISKPPTHTFEKIVTRDRSQKALKEF